MHRIETSIRIEAPADRVWSMLMDFAAYPRWNPFVRSIEGRAQVGETLSVRIQPPGSNGMRFRPAVLAVDPGRELRWRGKLLLPGLLDGEHYFRLEPEAGSGTGFRHGELFSGILVPLLRGTLDGPTKAGFVAMNEALKREAERR